MGDLSIGSPNLTRPWIMVDIITLDMESGGHPLRKFHYLIPKHARTGEDAVGSRVETARTGRCRTSVVELWLLSR
jgi:hypothetical protein